MWKSKKPHRNIVHIECKMNLTKSNIEQIATSKKELDQLTYGIVGAAIEVHKTIVNEQFRRLPEA